MRQEEKRKIDDCDMEKFGTLGSSEKTIAILREHGGHRRRNSKGIRQEKKINVKHGKF